MMNQVLGFRRCSDSIALGEATAGVPGPRLRMRPWVARLGFIVLGLSILAASTWRVASAAEITDQNVDQMLAAAKTPEDHQALAAYFTAKAAAAGEQAKTHERMLNALQGQSKPPAASMWRSHCNNLIRTFRNQQDDYKSLAKVQETIAKTLSGAHQ